MAPINRQPTNIVPNDKSTDSTDIASFKKCDDGLKGCQSSKRKNDTLSFDPGTQGETRLCNRNFWRSGDKVANCTKNDISGSVSLNFAANSPSQYCQRNKKFRGDFVGNFIKSDLPQFIVCSTGTITACNEAFQDFWQRNIGEEGTRPLTVFGLVRLDCLSHLFESFSQALRMPGPNDQSRSQDFISGTMIELNEVESPLTKTSPHLRGFTEWSRTFPCKRTSSYHQVHHCGQERIVAPDEVYPLVQADNHKIEPATSLMIKLTFLQDTDPSKRCFHGIMTENFILD